MSNDLTPENEQFIQHEIESGGYKSRDDVLNDAIRMLKQQRALQRDILDGINSGPSIAADEVEKRLRKRISQIAESTE